MGLANLISGVLLVILGIVLFHLMITGHITDCNTYIEIQSAWCAPTIAVGYFGCVVLFLIGIAIIYNSCRSVVM
jgi:hypothetical protein